MPERGRDDSVPDQDDADVVSSEATSDGGFGAALTEWLGQQGAGFALVPRDQALVAQWRQSGVPVGIVVEALNDAVSRRGRPARDLTFAARHVDEAIATYRRTHPSTHTRQLQTPARPAVTERLVAAGRATTDESVRKVLRAAYRQLRGALAREEPPHLAWGRAREVITDGLEALLRPDERARLQRDVTSDPRYLSMSAEAATAHERRARQRWLAARFGLADLLE